jgi:hypothetical protein
MRLWGDRREEERGSDVAALLDAASSGIGEVVDAAERAVAQMRAYDDEAGADTRINRERLVKELVGSVLERTESLRAEAGKLAEILERAGSRLEQTGERPAPDPAAGSERSGETEPALDVANPSIPFTGRRELPERRVVTDADAGGPPAEGVRLLATQMAVAGSDRAEVENRLARDFGVRDAGHLLDELFSGERASGVR